MTRLAMWSGPRNISTAMMRAWENRPDTAVWDEPLYAHYLTATGIDHPGRDTIIAAGDPDWRRVVARLTGPLPDGKAIFYQKHMTHHLLPQIDREWLLELNHCFLIRDPREVLLSYSKARQSVTLEDIGLPQQLAIFEYVASVAPTPPPVIDAADFLASPRAYLQALCDWLGIAFDTGMLSWPAGPRASDGVWASHWYASVWRSTGFTPYQPRTERLPRALEPLAAAAEPYYATLHRARLQLL